MKLYRLLSMAVAVAFLVGCSAGNGGANPTSTSSLPTPVVHVTQPPEADPQNVMHAFLDAWQKDDYASMYSMISQDSQQKISQEDFVKRYNDAMNSLTLKELSYELLTDTLNPKTAQVNFRVIYKTRLVGDLTRDLTSDLKLENGGWKINWDDGLVLPELRGGNRLSMDPDVPERGIIYDRNDQPLVTQTDVVALAINPAQLTPDSEPALISELSQLTGQYPGVILNLYDSLRGTDWYVPVGEAPADVINHRISYYSSLGGLIMTQYTSRFYYNNGIAPQAVGYISQIPKEQIDKYLREGYSFGARVGQIGIEKWAENYLAGKTGGTLYVISPEGAVISNLGKTDSQPASSVHLTIDQNLQIQAQKALTGFNGSIVVLERDTGRVLAMVSSPEYDPNLFDANNANSSHALGDLLNDPARPMYNRATQGQYPLGSVFKVITFSAALESGTFTPQSPFDCQYAWNGLTDHVRYDWTWEHFQDEFRLTGEGKTRPTGKIDLTGALMRSCNPYFWQIGLDLYNQGRVTAIADMARGFGLGKETGIGEVEEEPGVIINPPGLVEAVNQAIGQGDVQVTPLQVADFMAAIGNGGTLYRPQLVEKIVDANGVETTLFKPESRGVLPMKPETLAALRKAMREVITNPRGTAHNRFYNFTIPIYGKTGTAESNTGTPHAWFAGYTDANIEGMPDIAIAVIAENQGEGSEYAAPIFRRVAESYFYGHPTSPYWWESNIGITRTPTQPITETPFQ